MSTQINTVLDGYHLGIFVTFDENNKSFKKNLINKLIDNENKSYVDIVATAFDFIDGIEKNLDLLYDAMSKIYVLEKDYKPSSYPSGTTINFTENNFKEMAKEGIEKLYVPFLRDCWQFVVTFKGSYFNNYANHHQFHREYSTAFEAIRGIEKNILGLIKVLSF